MPPRRRSRGPRRPRTVRTVPPPPLALTPEVKAWLRSPIDIRRYGGPTWAGSAPYMTHDHEPTSEESRGEGEANYVSGTTVLDPSSSLMPPSQHRRRGSIARDWIHAPQTRRTGPRKMYGKGPLGQI